MRSSTLVWFTLLVRAAGLGFAQNTIQSTGLSFRITSGDNDNYFLRDNVTSCQLLVTSSNETAPVRRVVFALPAGNSGALAYFLPMNTSSSTNSSSNSSELGISLVDGSFVSTTGDFNNTGAQADFNFTTNATLGVIIIGAVRAMRDYVEGMGLTHEIFNYTLKGYNNTFIQLHRQDINATDSGAYITSDLFFSIPDNSTAEFQVTPGNNGTYTPPTINILTAGQADVVRLQMLTNETTIPGLAADILFLNDNSAQTPGLKKVLDNISNSTLTSDEVSFLTYSKKFTAGGWRFLTYFGRDTMIALRLLMPTLTSEAVESVLGAVIERANSTGALCHEETLGDYASFVNIGNNQSYLGRQPYYDYKMIDTDLYLLPAMSHYFLDLPQGENRSSDFFAKNATLQNGTYAEILARTIDYNLQRAVPFFTTPVSSNLLAFRPGEPVGQWRDSNQGTGYGPIPFDVNTALVPASLRATAALLRGGIVSGNWSADAIDEIAAVWEQQAPSFFEVQVNASTAQSRLQNFVQAANLSNSLLQNATGGNYSDTNFYALSLMEDGIPVQVMNSDVGFNLVYGTNVSQSFLENVLSVLQPYPKGLLTNVGMVVANPAYDSNTTNVEVLNEAAYHGTVVWSFQQGLMAGGLTRQLGFCSSNRTDIVDINTSPTGTPSWCNDTSFVQSLEEAQSRLWASIRSAQDDIFSEVWTYSFDNSSNSFTVADLAAILPDGTEADAIQLWSFGFLSLLDPSGSTIAS